MRIASRGRRSTSLPLRLNISTMVNNSAASVSGLIAGRKRVSYQSAPRMRVSSTRPSHAAANGMPRYTSTALAMVQGLTSITLRSRPNSGGSTDRNSQAYRLKNAIWNSELNATRPATYRLSPRAS